MFLIVIVITISSGIPPRFQRLLAGDEMPLGGSVVTARLDGEFGQFRHFCPPDCEPEDWQSELDELTARLVECCRAVDPDSTDKALEEAERPESTEKE